MEEYRLYRGNGVPILMVAIPIVMVAIGVLGMILPALRNPQAGPPLAFGILFCCLAVAIAVFHLRQPNRIEWPAKGRILFVAPLRSLEVGASEVRTIRPYRQLGYLRIETDRGKVVLLNQFDGFHRFLTRLELENPNVEIRGC
jgi:hypothetical protein